VNLDSYQEVSSLSKSSTAMFSGVYII